MPSGHTTSPAPGHDARTGYLPAPAASPTLVVRPRQAALLAVALPSPRTRDPANPSRGLNRLANVVEARARAAGDYAGCVG